MVLLIIRLPAEDLTVDRFDRGWVEPEDWYDSHLTSYIKRFKKEISYVRFDSGRPSIWQTLARDNGVKKIEFGIIKDHDYRDSDEYLNSAYDF